MMNSIDLTPLYRSSIGFDRMASLLDSALNTESVTPGYPPYNIEIHDQNQYAITLAVAGFEKGELDIKVEKDVLTVSGKKDREDARKYLHQGIAHRTFERKFNLADYVKVTEASLNNGLLTISLIREIPEAMKPKAIAITDGNSDQTDLNQESRVLEHDADRASPVRDEQRH
ncbi:Hsp20 family protein [Pseudomaricurvus hydrocarbonicus]